jgi:hypothetical protein
MAVITVTASQVAAVREYEQRTFISAATVTPGQVCYLTTGGSADLAKADAGSTSVVEGIALGSAYPGQPVTLIRRGVLNLGTSALGTALAFGSPLYLSGGTAGQIVDAAPGSGLYKVLLGRVTTNSDTSMPRLFQVDISFSSNYGTTALPA